MSLSIFQIEAMQKILLNTVFVSIPEEIYFVLFTYIMMGEFDQWKDEDCKRLFQPWDYPRILIPAISSAVVSNVLRYTGNDNLNLPLSFLTSYIFILIMGDIFNNAGALKWMGKCLFFLLLGTLSAGIIELLYAPFVVYGIGKTMGEINESILNNFFISLPIRIIEYLILSYLIVNKRSIYKMQIIKELFSNRVLAIFATIAILSNIIFIFVMYKFVCYEKALANYTNELKLLIVLGICFFPTINLSALTWCVYYLKCLEAIRKKTGKEKINKILNNLRITSKGGNKEQLVWALNGLIIDLEVIANEIYYEEMQDRR